MNYQEILWIIAIENVSFNNIIYFNNVEKDSHTNANQEVINTIITI